VSIAGLGCVVEGGGWRVEYRQGPMANGCRCRCRCQYGIRMQISFPSTIFFDVQRNHIEHFGREEEFFSKIGYEEESSPIKIRE
jgi:hypothetical protein